MQTALLYARLVRAQVRSQTQYRASFVLDLASSGMLLVLDVGAILVLFRVTPALGGYSVREVLVMVGLGSCAFSTADMAVGNVERLRVYVRTGLLDAVLTRPLSSLGQLVALDFSARRTGRTIQAIVLLAVSVIVAGVDWTPARVAMVVLAPVCGAVFFASVYVAGATVAFWFIESGELANAFTYGGRDFTTYPVTVYGGWFRRIFAYGLGFAFVSYYPGLVLLGRPDPLGAPRQIAWLAPLVAALAAVAASLVWRTGVRHYRSTGS